MVHSQSSIFQYWKSFLSGVISSSLVWIFMWRMLLLKQSDNQNVNCEHDTNNCTNYSDNKANGNDNDEDTRCRNDGTNKIMECRTDDPSSSVHVPVSPKYNPWLNFNYNEGTASSVSPLTYFKKNSSSQSHTHMWQSFINNASKRILEIPTNTRKKIRWPWESLRKRTNTNINTNTNTDINTNSGDHSSTNTNNTPQHIATGYSAETHDGSDDSYSLHSVSNDIDVKVDTFRQTNNNTLLKHQNQHHIQSTDKTQNNIHDYQPSISPITNNHDLNKFFSQIPTSTEKTGLCIGNIFGLDVGGTLAKLVYFEKSPSYLHNDQHYHYPQSSSSPPPDNNYNNYQNDHFVSQHHPSDTTLLFPPKLPEYSSSKKLTRHSSDSIPESLDTENTTHMQRTYSMFSLAQKKSQALDQFYAFVKRLDSYELGFKEKLLSFYSEELEGDFHFIQFETRHMEKEVALIRANNLHQNIVQMGCCGGGAHKYANEWENLLGIKMVKQDELDSLVAGMQFILADVIGECYTFKPQDDHVSMKSDQQSSLDQYWWSKKVKRDIAAKDGTYPYMVVMIGTGVSVLRVDGPRKHVRVSGSTIGGGTYWGLCRLLTDVEDFDSVLNLAERGDPSKVDMMVGDIYGANSNALEKLGLTSDVVASSFGKLVAKQDPAAGLKQEDLARALLLMVTNNIGQVAYLNAKLHNTERIYFVGNFLRHNIISQQRLSYAINYWSRGKMEALFLEHEGYFGAMGAFLLSREMPRDKETISRMRSMSL